MMQALRNNLPQIIDVLNSQGPKTAQAQLGTQQAVQPGYADLYNANQLASAQTEANVAGGPGAQLVSLADKYQQQLDPQYYAARGNLGNAINTYLTSYDPTKLTPTEEAQISRGINATTGPVTPSNMNTIRNAQTFGSAGTQRWQNFGDAITKASTALPQLRSGMNGFNIATQRGQNNQANEATNNAFNANYGFANNYLGNITSAMNTALNKKPIKDPFDMAMSASGTLGNVVGAGTKVAGAF